MSKKTGNVKKSAGKTPGGMWEVHTWKENFSLVSSFLCSLPILFKTQSTEGKGQLKEMKDLKL